MNKEKIVYEVGWLIEKVYYMSDKIRNKVGDQTKFEERCIYQLHKYISGGEGRHKHRRYLNLIIQRVAADYIVRYKKERAELFTDLSKLDDEGNEVEFEPIDVLADVESEVIAKEMTALLAQDGRRKTVLDAWLIGNTNGKQISRLLAQSFGGKPETHRKFVQRFEKECQERLKSAV